MSCTMYLLAQIGAKGVRMLDVLRKGERAHTREFKREHKRECQARGRTSHVQVQMSKCGLGLGTPACRVSSLKYFH